MYKFSLRQALAPVFRSLTNVCIDIMSSHIIVIFRPQVYLWVLNEEKAYKRAFELGADGVMTDFPTKLEHFLEENPQYIRN